jgi:hypothetical protein
LLLRIHDERVAQDVGPNAIAVADVVPSDMATSPMRHGFDRMDHFAT